MDSALTAAWEKVFEESSVDDLAEYELQGWMSVSHFAKKFNLSLDTAHSRLKRMAESGKIERKKIRAMLDGRIRIINIYRPRI